MEKTNIPFIVTRLSDQEALDGGDAQRERITELGLQYNLLTQYTSFCYARDKFSITRHLAESLAVPKTRVGLGEPSALSCVIEENSPHCPGLYLTTHKRLFSWLDGRAATPIDLYHSWHEC